MQKEREFKYFATNFHGSKTLSIFSLHNFEVSRLSKLKTYLGYYSDLDHTFSHIGYILPIFHLPQNYRPNF